MFQPSTSKTNSASSSCLDVKTHLNTDQLSASAALDLLAEDTEEIKSKNKATANTHKQRTTGQSKLPNMDNKVNNNLEDEVSITNGKCASATTSSNDVSRKKASTDDAASASTSLSAQSRKPNSVTGKDDSDLRKLCREKISSK